MKILAECVEQAAARYRRSRGGCPDREALASLALRQAVRALQDVYVAGPEPERGEGTPGPLWLDGDGAVW